MVDDVISEGRLILVHGIRDIYNPDGVLADVRVCIFGAIDKVRFEEVSDGRHWFWSMVNLLL